MHLTSTCEMHCRLSNVKTSESTKQPANHSTTSIQREEQSQSHSHSQTERYSIRNCDLFDGNCIENNNNNNNNNIYYSDMDNIIDLN